MKIRSHSESHLVELDDVSKWKIFPGDLDITLHWGLTLTSVSSRLRRRSARIRSSLWLTTLGVRVIAATKEWPIREVKKLLKDG